MESISVREGGQGKRLRFFYKRYQEEKCPATLRRRRAIDGSGPPLNSCQVQESLFP